MLPDCKPESGTWIDPNPKEPEVKIIEVPVEVQVEIPVEVVKPYTWLIVSLLAVLIFVVIICTVVLICRKSPERRNLHKIGHGVLPELVSSKPEDIESDGKAKYSDVERDEK